MVNGQQEVGDHSPFTHHRGHGPKTKGRSWDHPLRRSARSVRPLRLAVVVSALLMARGQIAGAFAIFLVLAGRIFLGTFVVALDLAGGEGLGRILVRLFRARVDAGGARIVVVVREVVG